MSKRKVSVSLDADLVDELEQATDEGLSGQVNEAVRTEGDRRRRRRALRALLDRLDLEEGPSAETMKPRSAATNGRLADVDRRP